MITGSGTSSSTWTPPNPSPCALSEFASNKTEDHEILMLALHLLQVSLVYVNTLMIQQVLAQPAWQGRLTARDLRALTPLKWLHINPYGTFALDMRQRLPLDLAA